MLSPPSLDAALQGVQTAYLMHLMSGSSDFEEEDRQAATNFAAALREPLSGESSTLADWGTTATPSYRHTCVVDMRWARDPPQLGGRDDRIPGGMVVGAEACPFNR